MFSLSVTQGINYVSRSRNVAAYKQTIVYKEMEKQFSSRFFPDIISRSFIFLPRFSFSSSNYTFMYEFLFLPTISHRMRWGKYEYSLFISQFVMRECAREMLLFSLLVWWLYASVYAKEKSIFLNEKLGKWSHLGKKTTRSIEVDILCVKAGISLWKENDSLWVTERAFRDIKSLMTVVKSVEVFDKTLSFMRFTSVRFEQL